MFGAYPRPKYQVSVYRTIGHLVRVTYEDSVSDIAQYGPTSFLCMISLLSKELTLIRLFKTNFFV